MNLDEIIADLEQKVAEARQIAEQLPVLEERLAVARDLRAEYNGGGAARPSVEIDWSKLSRRKAILAVLRESRRPLSPAEISNALQSHGREGDGPNYVSAALANLKKAGKVATTGFAQWVPADRDPPGDPRKGDLLGFPRPKGGES